MSEFLQYTVNGLIAGSSYGLLALAMTLIYGILSVPNFALGGIYSLGAFIAYYVVQWLGPAYYLFSIVPAVLIGMLIAIVTERIIFRTLYDAPHAAGFIAGVRNSCAANMLTERRAKYGSLGFCQTDRNSANAHSDMSACGMMPRPAIARPLAEINTRMLRPASIGWISNGSSKYINLTTRR